MWSVGITVVLLIVSWIVPAMFDLSLSWRVIAILDVAIIVIGFCGLAMEAVRANEKEAEAERDALEAEREAQAMRQRSPEQLTE